MEKILTTNLTKTTRRISTQLFLVITSLLLTGSSVLADPHIGQSLNVVLIGGSTLDCNYSTGANSVINGGCFPVTGPVGGLGDFIFSAMPPADVNTANLTPYDTALLNVASSGIYCNLNILTAQQKSDLVSFVAAGNKLIIYDSECSAQDYSWLPFAFTTNNPGAMGAQGTLTIVEDNYLSTEMGDPSCLNGDIHCIDATYLGGSTDAVGDMNVLTSYDPNWCVDMSGTNILGTTGPVHTYAKYPAGTDSGLIIYNGLDVDYMNYYSYGAELEKIWLQELQQPFNPSNLPCGVTVVGISISPATAVNPVDTDHTVTARLADLLLNPQVGVEVTFTITSGPNAGDTGICTDNADCTTDANGEVSFTYNGDDGAGVDQIQACFIDQTGAEVCSQTVSKEWIVPQITCDVNSDGAVNIDDITLIRINRGGSDLTYDIDGDGVVTVLDARKCVLECDNPRCAP